jgi:16S rRNA (adenine1518-N6/adenine1519-N6)-dimethyltransferase
MMNAGRGISVRTKEILSQYGIKLKKSLGQNFLIDPNILNKIIKAASLTQTSGVLEIGPGIGALTERIAEVASKVVAIEIDPRFLLVLKQLFKSQPNIQMIHGDILKIDLEKVIKHISKK